MTFMRIGSMDIHRVEEKGHILALPLDALMPGASVADALHAHPWLAPHHLDAPSSRLVSTFQSWVIRTGRHVVVVDTCSGNHRDRPTFPPAHQLDTPYLARLAAAGLRPDDVDFVMCTHLHVDHVGWNTRLLDGQWIPTFPNAKYIFSKTEFETFDALQHSDPAARVNHGSFRDSVMPIVEASLAHMVEGEHHISNGLIVKPAAGHTPGHCMLEAKSQGQEGWFIGDVMHHPLQICHPERNSPFCADQLQARATRRSLLEAAADHDVTLFPAHFGLPYATRVVSGSTGFAPAFALDTPQRP